ncbi:hypothetical protein JD844_008319 [Phrynosoma platyrhinos]|uniref:UmuC domain-containing protein n=1 Tax=Phrynosoma platyrhinos TaxID=52577 RepID=A0ABQ7TDU4_PHRPL|nr:hypothetical protein JD844_008319 [Phrynosoma platyrhinos]
MHGHSLAPEAELERYMRVRYAKLFSCLEHSLCCGQSITRAHTPPKLLHELSFIPWCFVCLFVYTALLEEFTPLVERLGFDEHFVDITEMVDLRLEQWKKDAFSKITFSGHIYNKQTVSLQDPAHMRLAVGSQIAAELREAMYHRLGLTGCAGVASNKLLAKLVSGTFKPNQQSVLLPESHQDLMVSLDHIQKVPGIGFKTAKRLMKLGLSTVCELQFFIIQIHIIRVDCPPASRELCGIFDILKGLSKDGRKPHTIRLTLRQFSLTNKWFNRESRQCPIPSHLVQRIGTDDASIKTHLVAILMKLFHKMINVKVPFHLTLLNVCFSNFKGPPASTKESIGFYLTHPSLSSSWEKLTYKMENVNAAEHAVPEDQMKPDEVLSEARNVRNIKAPQETWGLSKQTGIPEVPLHVLPSDIDYDVFNQLPEEIKEEIINGQKGEGNTTASLLHETLSARREELLNKTQDRISLASLHSPSSHQNISACGMAPASGWKKGSELVLPPTVDPKTFSELPEEMQKELLEEWKCRTPVSKMQLNKTHDKLKIKKKNLPSLPQSNSLLRYFKPK